MKLEPGTELVAETDAAIGTTEREAGATGAAVADKMPRSLVLLFAVTCGLSVANVYYAQPLLDTMARDFGIARASIGIVMTATQIGCALALLLVVPLGDLLNRRRLVIVQLLLLGLALVVVGIAPGQPVLLAGMVAVGLLGTAMTQGLIAYAATLAAPAERGRVVGAAASGVVIGLLLARSMAGLLADLAGWRSVYFASAALAVLMIAVLSRMLPRQAQPTAGLSYQQLLRSMATLLAQERVLQVRGVLAMLMFAAFSVFWTSLVLPLSEPPLSLSHSAIGAFGLVGAVGWPPPAPGIWPTAASGNGPPAWPWRCCWPAGCPSASACIRCGR